MKTIAELEVERGCSRRSKLFEITEDVKHRYTKLDHSFKEIADAYPELHLTKGMIAGYVFRNQLKHIVPKPFPIKPGLSYEVTKARLAKRHEIEEQRRRTKLGFPDAKTLLEQKGGCWFNVGLNRNRRPTNYFVLNPRQQAKSSARNINDIWPWQRRDEIRLTDQRAFVKAG